jgi:hypothetical protein
VSKRYRTIALAAASGALAVSLTGCSDDGSSASSEETATPRASVSASAPKDSVSPKESVAPKNKPAIVLGECGADATRTLSFLKPEDGGVQSTKHIKLSTGQQTLFDCMGARTGAMERAAFDKGFEKLAIMQSMQDDETLVGYVTPSLIKNDDASGSMRDLSGIRPDDGGFGAKKRRSIPAFDPTTGNMFFVENGDPGKLLSVNPNIGATADAQPKEIPNSDDVVNGTGDDDALYFFPHSDEVQNDYRTRAVYSPDGKMGFAPGDSNNIAYGDIDGGDTKMIDLPLKDGNYVGLEPVAYLSETSFIAISSSPGKQNNVLYRVTLTGDSLSTEPMLVDTDGEIYDVTLAPDGKSMAFILEKSDSTTLFKAEVGTKVTPKPLRELEGTHLNTKILDWQLAS